MRDKQVATFLETYQGFTRGVISSEKPNLQSSLSEILESKVSGRFYLSPLACRGILRRAEKRGKTLPPMLQADAGEDGTGRGTPIVFGWQNSSSQGLSDSEHVSPTLDKSKTPAVAVSLRGREGGGTAELGDEIANALRASGGGGDKAHVMTFAQDHAAGIKQSEISGTLTKEGPSGSAGGNGAEVLMLSSTVRRLTPVECERLQGFPDDYTNIPYRGKPTSPDGPRYKALGNSWAVPKFTWVGERIARFMPVNDNDKKKEAA